MALTSNGGSGDVLNSLIAQLEGSQNAANTAGLAQYQNLLGSVDALTKNIVGKGGVYSKAGQLIANSGNTAIADSQENTKNQVGQADQDLISRGLGNSTIRPNVLTGIQNKGQREVAGIKEGVAAQRANLLTQQAGSMMDLGRLNADSILSKSNQTPDMSMYLKLIQQLAASNVGAKPTMFSNAGSINALNGPNTAFSSSIPSSPVAPAPQQGSYITGSSSSLSGLGYGGLEHPGDHFFS